MTITNGYCTLAEAKARLWPPGAPADTTDDTTLEGMIEAASRKIDNDTGRRFYSNLTDETRYFTAHDPDCVFTDDIISVTTLKTDNDGDRTYENTFATTDYDLLPDNATLTLSPYTWIETSPFTSQYFPTQRKGIEITGKFGYAASTTVSETRIKTADNANFLYVDDLNTLPVGGLLTDDDDDGVYETTWVLTTDFIMTPVPNTASTWLEVSGAKTFPLTADGVSITGSWGAIGAPKNVKEACLVLLLIEQETRNAFGGMGTQNNSLTDLQGIYDKFVASFKRLV